MELLAGRGLVGQGQVSLAQRVLDKKAVARFGRDAAGRGVGRRTSMKDASGSTSWTYDARGRVGRESQSVIGVGGATFITEWTYDAADRVSTVSYPDGEVVYHTYGDDFQLRTVAGQATYVGETTYNASNQITQRWLAGGQVKTTYTYAAATLRLQRLQSGKTTVNDLQDLEYGYDAVGNVDWIKDYRAGSPYQLHDFDYDALNRLTSAQASGGSAASNYSESYSYNAIGNLLSKSSVGAFTYGAQAAACPSGALYRPHTVVTTPLGAYCYDRNGNLEQRTLGAATDAFSYDAENRLTSVSGAHTAGYTYNGDGQRVKTSTGVGVSATITTTNSPRYELSSRYWDDFESSAGTGWSPSSGTWTRLQVAGPPATWVYQQSSTTTNTNASHAVNQSGELHFRWVATYVSSLNAGLYLLASAATGAERGNGYRIWQDAANVYIYKNTNHGTTLRATFPAANQIGQKHSYGVIYKADSGVFRLMRDGALLGSWADTAAPWRTGSFIALRTDGGTVQFDEVAVSTVVKYYYAGAQRIALREGGAAAYLLGDHLGSTSVTTNDSGGRTGELWYKAWGEARGGRPSEPRRPLTSSPANARSATWACTGSAFGCTIRCSAVGCSRIRSCPTRAIRRA